MVTTVPGNGLKARRTRSIARRALPLAVAALAALPQLCLAAFTGDPLHPLGGGVSIELIIGRVVGVILGILGSLSLVMFVFGGITWMTAAGNEEKIKKAKNTIVYSVFGLIVAFSSYALLNVLMEQIIKPSVKNG